MLLFPLTITLPVAALAALTEALLGYPTPVFNIIGHPVMWIGALINKLDQIFNRSDSSETKRRLAGFLALFIMLTVTLGVTGLALKIGDYFLPASAMFAFQVIATTTLVAQKSLWAHVYAVLKALRNNGLTGGRQAVSQIVGRDTKTLDEAGIVRAALESLAENFSDGIVAPLLWAALFGLPGAVFYKTVNTADSMIGHLTPRHAAFGMASARLDDLINLPASRLAALCIICAAPFGQHREAIRAVWNDAGKHRSPNAGWPEAAMAGALTLRLAGPRFYNGQKVPDHWMGNGSAQATTADLRRGLGIYCRACGVLIILLLCASLSCMIIK